MRTAILYIVVLCYNSIKFNYAFKTSRFTRLSTSIQCNNDSIFDIDFEKYAQRMIKMQENRINRKSIYCEYCNGYGFLRCDKCKYGCLRCERTTYERCYFCKGDGNAKLAYNYIPNQK